MKKLDDAALSGLTPTLPAWRFDAQRGGTLTREFRFADFAQAFGFMTQHRPGGREAQPPSGVVQRLQPRRDHADHARRRRGSRPARHRTRRGGRPRRMRSLARGRAAGARSFGMQRQLNEQSGEAAAAAVRNTASPPARQPDPNAPTGPSTRAGSATRPRSTPSGRRCSSARPGCCPGAPATSSSQGMQRPADRRRADPRLPPAFATC